MEGLSEDNMSLLQSLTVPILTVGLPTIVGGDFNLTVEQLTESSFPQKSGLEFMSLNDTTCLEGQQRCIDHILGSPAVQRLSKDPHIDTYTATLPGRTEPHGFYPHLVTTCSIPKLN